MVCAQASRAAHREDIKQYESRREKNFLSRSFVEVIVSFTKRFLSTILCEEEEKHSNAGALQAALFFTAK